MADWDQDGPALSSNLERLLRGIRDAAECRGDLDLSTIRQWHLAMMDGLEVPSGAAAGVFRGEQGLAGYEVGIGSYRGSPSVSIARELADFEGRLHKVVARLDQEVPPGSLPNEDQLGAVIEFCAWAHSEWVRIHPFANGNGLTARLLANAIAMRYGLPPFVRLRPRPESPYGWVAAASMAGDWAPTAALFHLMLEQAIG